MAVRFIKICLIVTVLMYGVHGFPANNTVPKEAYKLYSRDDWGAAASTATQHLKLPVPMVVMHHTYIPGICLDEATCMKDMRSMQRYHMETLEWGDIGYNFCVGGEGGVYEGRGWKITGVHAGKANSHSIGICLIGDFREQLPTKKQLEAAKALIADGVTKHFISPQYKLVRHNSFMATACPGAALTKELSTWKNYDDTDYTNKVPSIAWV